MQETTNQGTAAGLLLNSSTITASQMRGTITRRKRIVLLVIFIAESICEFFQTATESVGNVIEFEQRNDEQKTMPLKKGKSASQLVRENAKWRRELVAEIGRCQMPDCTGRWPTTLHVHEISCGTGGRPLGFAERLACIVACDYCNQNTLTNYAVWSPERQAALQILLCAAFAKPQEILDVINFCRGRAADAISWSDCAKHMGIIGLETYQPLG